MPDIEVHETIVGSVNATCLDPDLRQLAEMHTTLADPRLTNLLLLQLIRAIQQIQQQMRFSLPLRLSENGALAVEVMNKTQ